MKNISKYFLSVFILLSLIFPGLSFAITDSSYNSSSNVEELQNKISSLMAKIKELQAQIDTIKNGNSNASWCYDFNNNFGIGTSGNDVSAISKILMKEGIVSRDISSNGFSEEMASHISSFQEKYKSEILSPSNLKSGTGYVGKATRAKLNRLYGCVNSNIYQKTEKYNIDDEKAKAELNKIIKEDEIVAKNKYADARLKANISQFRAFAEIWYDDHNNSYTGLCSDKKTSSYVPSDGVQSFCNDSATSYAANVKLNSAGDGYWCVDSTGASKSVTSSIGQGTSCPGSPTPSLTTYSIFPKIAAAGEVVTISGNGFAPNSIVNWSKNGNVIGSTFGANIKSVTPNQLVFILDPVFVANTDVGTYQISVSNGSQRSNSVDFTITKPVPPISNTPTSIKVINPNGGEVYYASSTILVSWSTTNAPADSVASISLYNQSTGAMQYGFLSAYCFENKNNNCVGINSGNKFIYLPATLVPGQYKIRVVCSKPNSEAYCGDSNNTSKPEDLSDNFFTIAKADNPISITTSSPLPNATVGKDYLTMIEIKGTGDSSAWSTTGSVPPGISYATPPNGSTCMNTCYYLGGIPTLPGTYDFTFSITSGSQSISKPFTITVLP